MRGTRNSAPARRVWLAEAEADAEVAAAAAAAAPP